MSGFITFANSFENPQFNDVSDVDPKEVQEKKQSLKLIDVRQPDEFTGELGHIPGAELIVLNELPQKLNELPRDQTIVFICRSGNRSAQATAFALENGFTSVYNMAGGMLRWNELNLETTEKNE